MKKLLTFIAITLLALIVIPARALMTTNIVAPITISTGWTNGQPCVFYTFSLPAPKFILDSYYSITNVNGTNTLAFQGNVSVTPTNFWSFNPQSTNSQTDTISGSAVTNQNFTVVVTGAVANLGGTNNVQQQLQF